MLKERLNKKEILTIPNILSFVRILLIPFIVILYCIYDDYYGSALIIAISGLTDIIDGKIARKYNLISDFGKFIDPVADKLTQGAMVFCLITRYKAMIFLLCLMIIKETMLLVGGFVILKRTDKINGAKWYGKVSTVIMYLTMMVLFLLPDINPIYAQIGIFTCAVVLIGSTVLYAKFYYSILKKK